MKSMTAMNATRKQAGFTIIELVVVILLLGILTATALPRFMDVTDEAHLAVVDALEGGIATGSALFRAQWVAEGQPTIAVTEFDLFASSGGYPVGADNAVISATTGTDCAAIYTGILQSGGRPGIQGFATAGASTPIVATEAEIEGVTVGAGVDVLAALRADSDDVLDSEICDYYYVGQYQSGTVAAAGSVPYIGYNFTDGTIERGTISLNTD